MVEKVIKCSNAYVANDFKVYQKFFIILAQGQLYFFSDISDPKIYDGSVLRADSDFIDLASYQVFRVEEQESMRLRT